MHRTIGIILAVLIAFPGVLPAAEREVSVPLTSLVLFTSGVGYFQHDGIVDGDARMEMTFSTDQINDLLKSLVLRDLDGGSISSVTYSSRDPVERTLKSFSIDLTEKPTLAELLMQTRGEPVEVLLPDKLTGTIIGVEARQMGTNQAVELWEDFLTLLTAEGIRSVSLMNLQGIRFLRGEVQDELAQALQVLSATRGVEKKKVVLHFTGTGRRRVRIGYILEAPVWKTSYRLVLGEDSHVLQGWAMVENTSDDDWQGVGLSLVSGRPITFVMDLYLPLYVKRPEVQLEMYQSLVPQTYELAMDEAEAEPLVARKMAEAPSMAAAPMAAPAPSARGFGGALAAEEPFSVTEGVASVAQAGQVGELFQYAIEKPVALPRRESALLPIVNQTISGQRYSIYNESVQAKHPLNAVKLVNSSGLHLMQGPITVFDAGVYAGDALITDLAPGAEQLISYALDLDAEVESLSGSIPDSLVSVKISRGIFTYTNKLSRARTYSIRNRGARDKTILVEHPFQAEWTLVSPKEPMERSRDYYRFAVLVAAGKGGSLAVTEERIVEQSIAVTNLTNDRIDFYIKGQTVSQAVKTALQRLLQLKQTLAETTDQRTRLEARVRDIGTDQSRIRQNMERVSQISDLYRTYVKTLTDQEAELAKLATDIAKLRDQEASQRKELDAYILSIEVK